MSKFYKATTLCLLMLYIALFSLPVKAATKNPPGLTLSPVFQQVSIQPSQQAVPAKFSLTNGNTSAISLALSVVDLNTLSESGGLFIQGTSPLQLQQQYGLAKWAQLPINQITIAPKQTATVTVNILNLPTLTPGGHYGALMFKVIGSSSGSTSNSIALQPIASSLLFVTKLGGDTHKLSLKGVSYKRGFFNLPSQVTLHFTNTGNTHVIPRGIVGVYGSGGNQISKAIINQNSYLVFPETSRDLSVSFNQQKTVWWPGRYKLRVDYRFDGYDQFRSYQTSLFVIPWWTWLLGVLICVGIIAVWRWRRKALKQHPSSSQN